MPVDSFKYLPRIIAAFYQMTDRQPELPIPWTPLPRPLAECKFGLVTSGGLYHQGIEPPFDLEREKQEPTWGDPTYRTLPADIQQAEVGASHLHINTRDVLEDVNILLPIHRFQELAAEGGKPRGRIGGLAKHAYSFMGYQGFPSDTTAWQQTYGPQVAEKLKAEGVNCVLLTPA
jgi:D-proline reductase (dithiol) PrdB